jgi:hypothetical protein
MFSPLTIASYALTRPIVSSDLIVSISCSVCGAVGPRVPDLHLARSAGRRTGPAAQRLLGDERVRPVERAWILSSTRWSSFRMYM